MTISTRTIRGCGCASIRTSLGPTGLGSSCAGRRQRRAALREHMPKQLGVSPLWKEVYAEKSGRWLRSVHFRGVRWRTPLRWDFLSSSFHGSDPPGGGLPIWRIWLCFAGNTRCRMRTIWRGELKDRLSFRQAWVRFASPKSRASPCSTDRTRDVASNPRFSPGCFLVDGWPSERQPRARSCRASDCRIAKDSCDDTQPF